MYIMKKIRPVIPIHHSLFALHLGGSKKKTTCGLMGYQGPCVLLFVSFSRSTCHPISNVWRGTVHNMVFTMDFLAEVGSFV